MIKKIPAVSIFLFIVLSFSVQALNKPGVDSDIENMSYVFFLYYDKGNLFADRDFGDTAFDILQEKYSPETLNDGQAKFTCKLYNFKKDLVKTFEFDPQKGNSSFKAGKVSVKGPYVSDGLMAEFYSSEGVRFLNIFVSAASVCNNDGECTASQGESEKTCSSDCKKARVTAPLPSIEAATGGLMGGDTDITLILIYVIGAGIIIAGAFFGWKWWRKRKEDAFIPSPSSLQVPPSLQGNIKQNEPPVPHP